MLTHQVEHQVAEILAVTPVARTAALLRDETVGAGLVIGLQQPVDLTAAPRIRWMSSRRCNSFCDMVIKQDITTPNAHGLHQAESRHPCSQRWR